MYELWIKCKDEEIALCSERIVLSVNEDSSQSILGKLLNELISFILEEKENDDPSTTLTKLLLHFFSLEENQFLGILKHIVLRIQINMQGL